MGRWGNVDFNSQSEWGKSNPEKVVAPTGIEPISNV